MAVGDRYQIVSSDVARVTAPYMTLPGISTIGLPVTAPDPTTGAVETIPQPVQLVFDTANPTDGCVFLGVLMSDPDIYAALNTLADHVGSLEARLQAAEALLAL